MPTGGEPRRTASCTPPCTVSRTASCRPGHRPACLAGARRPAVRGRARPVPLALRPGPSHLPLSWWGRYGTEGEGKSARALAPVPRPANVTADITTPGRRHRRTAPPGAAPRARGFRYGRAVGPSCAPSRALVARPAAHLEPAPLPPRADRRPHQPAPWTSRADKGAGPSAPGADKGAEPSKPAGRPGLAARSGRAPGGVTLPAPTPGAASGGARSSTPRC